MRTILLKPLSYQGINIICVCVMVVFVILASRFLKSIQLNLSKFIFCLMAMYSLGLICDSIRVTYTEIGWESENAAALLGLLYSACMMFAAVSWFLYSLTRLHPKTSRNYILYCVAVLPAVCVIGYSVIIQFTSNNALNKAGEAQFPASWFWTQLVINLSYYILAIALAIVVMLRKEEDKKLTAFLIALFPIPYLISFVAQLITQTNYQAFGITVSFTLFICAALNIQGSEQSKELSHFVNIMDSLKSGYSSILYANLVKNRIEPYMVSENVTVFNNPDIKEYKYDDIIRGYSENIVYSPDKEMFCEKTSAEYVTKVLENQDRTFFDYRIVVMGEIRNMRLECWRAKNDVGISHVVMGFVDITERKRREFNEEKKNAILHGLVNKFEYVCYVNYANGECEEYHVSKRFDYFFNIIGETEPLKKFIAIFKHGMEADEYEEFKKKFDQNVILDTVGEQGLYSIDCRINLGNGVRHYNVTAGGNPNNPEGIIFGIVDIDNQVRAEIEKKERIKEKEYSIQLETTISERTAELHEKAKSLNQINEDITELLGNITEARDTESGTHIKRVKGYTKILANHIKDEFPEYGLDDEQIGLITSASALHDIGKIMIPDSILRKPGKFTKDEFEVMKSHCEKGCEVLKKAPKGWDKKYLDFSMEICRYHHEKWDGKGYPEGLSEDEIPISAQIVSVADCFDALTTKRVYKDAYELEEAFNMILRGECGMFSDKMMEAFKNAKEELFAQFFGGEEPKADIPNLATAKSLKDVTILLVEDNELTREITTEILEDEGANVTSLACGNDVLKVLEGKESIEYDAILMDLTLPDISGFDVTRSIREMDIKRAVEVPIIAITSSTDKQDVQKAYDVGMSSFMLKPISVSKLTRILLSSMRSEQKNLKTRLDEAIMRANKDPLTGVKNMTAYTEAVGELTARIANKEDLEFAIVMCDVNKLKTVNDSFGHDMGDKYIKNCCKLICQTYSHSPVYRIGGDEFAIILTGDDYNRRNELIDELGLRISEASKIDRFEDGKAKMAVGMSTYNAYSDFSVANVTKRADESMYSNKRMMEFGGLY